MGTRMHSYHYLIETFPPAPHGRGRRRLWAGRERELLVGEDPHLPTILHRDLVGVLMAVGHVSVGETGATDGGEGVGPLVARHVGSPDDVAVGARVRRPAEGDPTVTPDARQAGVK